MRTHSFPRLDSRPRLLLTGVPPAAVLARAESQFDLKVWCQDKPIGAALNAQLNGCDALVVMPGDRLNAETIAALPASVQVLGTYSVGTDHIDLNAATARRLPVFHTPDVLTDAVADLAIFLIIAAARHTSGAERILRDGRWGPWSPTSMLGRSLKTLRLGIFGMGRIGAAVAERALPFGMNIHYHNRTRLKPALERDAIFHATLDELMTHSDVLCICAPSTAELKWSINSERLNLLPQGAMVVNVARGDLIDEDALFDCAARGHLGCIATDVYCNEPAIDARWLQLDRATLLPHIGSATEEVRRAMGMLVLDGVASHFGEPVHGCCINPEAYASAFNAPVAQGCA
jgi:glyoxylate reductase